MMKVLKYGVPTLLALFVVLVLVIKFFLWEPSDIQRGSLVYHLKVPSEAQDFPLWEATSEPKYSISVGGGLEPTVTSFIYDSSITPRDLSTKLIADGYQCEHRSSASILCSHTLGVSQVQVKAAKTDNGTTLEVGIIGY